MILPKIIFQCLLQEKIICDMIISYASKSCFEAQFQVRIDFENKRERERDAEDVFLIPLNLFPRAPNKR